jgi:hypothetical protein
MPLQFVLDENLRGLVWQAILNHNKRGMYVLDAVRLGDVSDLPLGTRDRDILLWTERENRILISFDKTTLPGHLKEHLRSGHHCPGIFAVPEDARITNVLSFLTIAAYAGTPDDFRDQIVYIV